MWEHLEKEDKSAALKQLQDNDQTMTFLPRPASAESLDSPNEVVFTIVMAAIRAQVIDITRWRDVAP